MSVEPTPHLKIVVPIDGSDLAELAVPYAAALGGRDASLHLLRVIPRAEAIQGLWGGVVVTEAMVQEMTEAEAAEDLERALHHAGEFGPNLVGDVVAGDPADQIIQTGVRLGADMIVMASHGRGAVGRWTFGSVADRVARESLIPVAIVCPQPEDQMEAVSFSRIVVALDGSELSHLALPTARELSRRTGAQVLLVQAINPVAPLYPAIASGSIAGEEIYEENLTTQEREASRNLDDARAQLTAAGISVSTRILVGPTVPALESVIEPGDMIVITSHGRSGIRRWLLGSVAERLIRCAVAPVVLVPATERQRVRVPAFATELAATPAS